MIDSNNISVMREQLRKMNTESIKEAISEQGALIGSSPIPGGMTITEAVALALTEEGGIYRKRVVKELTVPSGASGEVSVEVDFSGDIPEGVDDYTIHCIGANRYAMPYIVNGNIKTWFTYSAGNWAIHNLGNAWTNYKFYFDIEYTI